jgi:hypothetical protein
LKNPGTLKQIHRYVYKILNMRNEVLRDMSIRSLTKEELSRRRVASRAAGKNGSETKTKTNNANDAIEIIMRYIPSEAIALYIAALPAVSSFDNGFRSAISSLNATVLHQPSLIIGNFHIDKMDLILLFAVLTGVLVVLSYAGDYNKNNNEKWKFFKRECWPWWGIISSMAAFMVWAWAIPNPLAEGGAEVSPISTFALIATSILLPMIGQVVMPSQES